MFKNKVLMITGGTGSFGNAVLKHFLNSDLKEIRIFSRDEKKQEDMRIEYKNDRLNFIIGNVRDFDSINNAMLGVDYVFHAAALKQVPSCEFYPMQAIRTNLYGAENVLEAAARNNVKKVVVLSTDKAAYPVNAMGTSKAVNLVLYAFEHAEPGDLFVQKAPAATIIDLATAVRELFHADNEIKIIGARHGEKMYETLCTKEEMSKAFDLGDFYRVPADFRDLNYTKYIQKDGPKLIEDEYNSANTRRLSVDELKQLLLSLDYVRDELKNY